MNNDRIIVISESKLREIIHQEVARVLNEMAVSRNEDKALLTEVLDQIQDIVDHQVTAYIKECYPGVINEMVCINNREFNGLFPATKFTLRIWSDDHETPHFHVIAEDWDILVAISNGDILYVKRIGKNSRIYTYVQDHIKDWLESRCASQPSMTNRRHAKIIWNANN